MGVVVEPLDGSPLDRAVQTFNLYIRPEVVGLGRPVLNPVGLSGHVEPHRPLMSSVPVSRLLSELNPPRHDHLNRWRSHVSIIEDSVYLIRHRFEHVLQELLGRLPVSFLDELGNRKLARAVDANEQE